MRLFQKLTEDMQARFSIGNFASGTVFQPVPTYYGDVSNWHGSNVLGFDRYDQNSILCVLNMALVGNKTNRTVLHGRLAQSSQ